MEKFRSARKGVRSMDFFAEKSDLAKELNFVRNAVEKRSTIPILSHFLLEAEGFELRITATDLEITARTTCQAKVRTKGAAIVPGVRFFEIVRSAESGEIRCRSLENHSAQITYGRSSSSSAWQKVISRNSQPCRSQLQR
jgi:DNA polymerase-3 subunit beta